MEFPTIFRMIVSSCAALEHECADIFHPGGITRVYFDGTIEQFPN